MSRIFDRNETLIAQFVTLPDQLAISNVRLIRGRVWCRSCGGTKPVDCARCLRSGWPKCCGATMTIDAPEVRG